MIPSYGHHPDSPQPQLGPAGFFHSQGGHGAGTPVEGLPPTAGTPLGDAYVSAAYTPPSVTESQIRIQSTSHYSSVHRSCSAGYNVKKYIYNEKTIFFLKNGKLIGVFLLDKFRYELICFLPFHAYRIQPWMHLNEV